MLKKKGTREEVYLGLAQTTSGNMKKNDIIKRNTRDKPKYLSRKISERMKIKKNLFKKQMPDTPKKTLKNNKKSSLLVKQLPNHNSSKVIKFNESNNICQEYYCDTLTEEKESLPKTFKIETLDSIDFDNLNLNDL